MSSSRGCGPTWTLALLFFSISWILLPPAPMIRLTW